jgi:hypothetical protein
MSVLEEKKTKPPDKTGDYFKATKLSLKHVLKNPEINSEKITKAVITCNKIVIHTLMFMKLYLLDYYEKNNKLPKINDDFVNACLKIQCSIEDNRGKPPSEETIKLKNELKTFYDKHYKPNIIEENLSYTHLNTVLDYLSTDIVTMYENNIKLHFVEYVEKYINVICYKKEIIDMIKEDLKNKSNEENKDKSNEENKNKSNEEIKNMLIKHFCKKITNIKTDVFNVKDKKYKSDEKEHKLINDIKKDILPNKEKFDKDSIYYDIQSNTHDYLSCMIKMMKVIESKGKKINNVFPLRSDIAPHFIKLDTCTIVHLLLTEKQGNKSFYTTKGNLKMYENKLWEFFFRTERKCFKKKGYTFHNMLLTDGVGCTILFKRNDLVGKRIPNSKYKQPEEYIDELTDYTDIKNKKLVTYDPNTGDLIYCVDDDSEDANEFRYTQDSRRKECKIKKFQKLILKFKEEKIEGKTIIEHETELSVYNRKTLDIENFKIYIKKKSELNNKLYKFYEKYIFRKLKLNGFINKKKHEQKLISNFKKIFGKPENVVVCAGDWSQKAGMISFGKESTKGIGMRKLFKQNGYKVYLVDEFKTSCMCSKCKNNNGRCETFKTRPNPKPYKDNIIPVHGLLKCKTCKTMWNRDVNSATNIYRIAKNAILQKPRPKYLCRDKKEDNNENDNKKIKSTKEKVKVNKSTKNKKSVGVVAST